MIYYKISALVNAAMALILAGFLLSKRRRTPTVRVFVILNIAVFIWAASYFLWQNSKDAVSALFRCRALSIGVPLTGLTFFHFVAHLLDRWKEMKKWIILGYSIVVFTILLMGTPLIVNRVEPLLSFSFWPMAGPLYFLEPLVYFIFSGMAVYLMWKNYPYLSQIKKNQVKFTILAGSVGFLSGASNFPQWYGIKIYPIFNGLVWIYTLLLFYAIIRYRLMEIDTVIHRTFLWILASALIFIPIDVVLHFVRPSLVKLNEVELAFVITVLVYVYLYIYPKVQPKIDHFFRRRKYDYYQILDEMGEKIGSELNINNVISRLFKELKEVLYIRNGLVLLQQLGQEDYTKAGSIGYGKLEDTVQERAGNGILYKNSLSQWLNEHKKALEREQIEIDPQYEPIKQEALRYMSQNMLELLIPIVMEDKLNGLVGIGKKENLRAYTAKDIELLEKMGRQLGVTIENALHHGDIVEKERMDQEMKLGREIQMNLLPRQVPQVPNLSIQGLMTPAREIGGDYYDFITLPHKDELAIVIGDVSGKGVAAGLLMAMVKASIHAFSQEGASPKQILLRTNVFIHQHIGGQKFMTMIYLQWHSQTRILTYSSAGHEHILIYRNQTQEIQAIQSGGFMLGMIPDIETFLEERQIQLQPQDKVLLYTDGVTEAENQQEERFSLSRLKKVFKTHSQKSAADLMQAVKDEVYAFIGDYPQYDDITLVAMEVT